MAIRVTGAFMGLIPLPGRRGCGGAHPGLRLGGQPCARAGGQSAARQAAGVMGTARHGEWRRRAGPVSCEGCTAHARRRHPRPGPKREVAHARWGGGSHGAAGRTGDRLHPAGLAGDGDGSGGGPAGRPNAPGQGSRHAAQRSLGCAGLARPGRLQRMKWLQTPDLPHQRCWY
jgi:hypothetical protein